MIEVARIFVAFSINALLDSITEPPHTTDGSDRIVDNEVTKNLHGGQLYIQYAIRGLLVVHHLYYNIGSSFSAFEVFCLAMIFAGFVLRTRSYDALGYLFTFDLCIRKGHQLVTAGPYERLMHPSYTGLLIFIFFSLLYFGVHYLLSIAYLVWSLYYFRKRMATEEKMLAEYFGREFEEYARTRYRLVPYIY